MFLTICQACHKGKHEDYEVNLSLAIKPLRDDFIQIYFGKHQTTIGKHSHRIPVTIPYFRGNYHS